MTYRIDRAIQDHSWRQDAAATGATKPAPNGALVYRLLSAHPYPVASDLRLSLDGVCRFGLDGVTWCFRDDGWHVLADTFAHHLPAADHVTAKLLHAEIGRVRALVDGESSPTWAEIKADCVGPDLPADDPLYDRAAAEQALAKVTAERDQARQAYLDLSTDNPLRPTVNAIAERLSVCPAEPGPMLAEIDRLKGLADAHTVVSQRLAGSQKEVAEVTERATKAEARVKRLLHQRAAAHAVLDEAAIGLEVEGSPRWTLARRCRTLAAEIWDHLDAVNAIDEIAKVVGLIPPSLSSGATDGEVVARVKALHNDDDLRAAIAVAVGLDGSASLSLILDTVKDRSPDLLRLVSYHQAPIKFNNRPLTLAERAAFVIRRLWQGRTNAAAEAAALRRELGDIADALGDLPDTAEREPIGDREEHLGLSTAERIWLSR